MDYSASLEKVNDELLTIRKRKEHMDHLSTYIDVLEKRNLSLVRLCNIILILLYFILYLLQGSFTLTLFPSYGDLITGIAAISKWIIAAAVLFLYIFTKLYQS